MQHSNAAPAVIRRRGHFRARGRVIRGCSCRRRWRYPHSRNCEYSAVATAAVPSTRRLIGSVPRPFPTHARRGNAILLGLKLSKTKRSYRTSTPAQLCGWHALLNH
jgi:hypothetical protein